jgi:hypothetical protein
MRILDDIWLGIQIITDLDDVEGSLDRPEE